MEIKLIFEDTNFIVIDKPAGISTHYSPGDNAANVVDLMKRTHPYLHPVSRLDNGTSGLLLLALKPDVVSKIELVQKSYIAQVFGIAPISGIIEKELVTKEFGTGRKKRQTALSRYRKIKSDEDTSCLLVHIETGRHHQIRKHLRSIGHPIVGDFRHGYKDKNLAYQEKLGERLRMMLHCSQLMIKHQKRILTFKAPILLQFFPAL